ncbi:hypothetical protein VP01_2165g3 [Puccinia sorghi]|uniref:Uncharacterized protein n=1 Tax=Puccinia sorghi TaxID=27349 RepID=A0A0L6V9J1_9BASI|nr:hypothetical protein VP01_2165g3 [Puccinia sorghi]
MGKRRRPPTAEEHLIPSQPAEQHQQKKKKKNNNNDQESVQHQQTIDHLLSEVSIPQIRSSNKSQDGNKRGTVRKLGQLVPNQTIQPSLVSLSGHRLLGPRNPGATGSGGGGHQEFVLTISRKKPFSLYLKRALAHLREPHPTPLLIRAMGCAISMAFSLALALESHLLLASPARLLKSLSTGTVVIEEPEIIYQTRNQASVEIKLSIKL